MISRMRKSMKEKDHGFTLIELLVVMIIIGILAAIAIPIFLNQRKKAAETAAKTDVSTIGKEVLAYYVDGTGTLFIAGSGGAWTIGTASGKSDVSTGNLSSSNTVTAKSTATSATAFCVSVDPSTAVTGAAVWMYTQNGLSKGACT